MYYYIVYLYRRNKKMDEVSKALGGIIENLRGSHLEVKEAITILTAPKPLDKETLSVMEKAFTEKAKEIFTELTAVEVAVEPATPEQISRIKIMKEVTNAS